MAYWRNKQSFTRPANTTQYGANDLVANSATAGSVVPVQFRVMGCPNGKVSRVALIKDANTTVNADFTIHFFDASPTVSNGDNGAYAVSAADAANWITDVNIDLSSGATTIQTDWIGKSADVNFTVWDNFYALLEVNGAYIPTSGETFYIEIDTET